MRLRFPKLHFVYVSILDYTEENGMAINTQEEEEGVGGTHCSPAVLIWQG